MCKIKEILLLIKRKNSNFKCNKFPLQNIDQLQKDKKQKKVTIDISFSLLQLFYLVVVLFQMCKTLCPTSYLNITK